MKILLYIIAFLYLCSLLINIPQFIRKQRLFISLKNGRTIKLSNLKTLNLGNDYEFVKLLLFKEYLKHGENILKNPSHDIVLISEIIIKKDASDYKDFIIKKRNEMINSLKKSKNLILTKAIVATCVISVAIICLV